MEKQKRRPAPVIEMIDNTIFEMLMKGESVSTIKQFLYSQGYSEKNAGYRIAGAYDRFRKSNEVSFEDTVAKYKEMYINLFKKMYEDGDYRGCNGVLDSLAKIEGLFSKMTIDGNLKIENYVIKFE